MSELKDAEEVRLILKDMKKRKGKYPPKEKPIGEWTASELKAYIVKETKGMGIVKKLKFAKELDDRIKNEKKINCQNRK